MALAVLPAPDRPRPGEVLVRMAYAPVNPADRLAIAGRYAPPSGFPEVIGAEGAGFVEAVGADVAGFAPGAPVILLSRGNWTSRRLVAAGDLLPVPPGLALDQAAMLRVNPATAFRLLERLAPAAGDWLIQNAARSSVARWVRILARDRGVHTIDIVRSGKAGEAMIADGDDLPERVAEAMGGAPLRLALDAVAGDGTGRLAACLAPGGRLLVYGHLSGEPCAIPSMLLTSRDLSIAGFSLRPAEQDEPAAARAALYARLAVLAARHPEPVAAVVPLSEIDQALAAAAEPGREGRILLALDC